VKTIFTVVISLVAGLIGGVVGQRITSNADVQSSVVVRANRFELLNGSGKMVSYWGFSSDFERTVLAFQDPSGKERMRIGMTDRSRAPEWVMAGHDGRPRINAIVDGLNSPRIAMSDALTSRILLGTWRQSDALGAEKEGDSVWRLVFRDCSKGCREYLTLATAQSNNTRTGGILITDSKERSRRILAAKD
jgi:hypothetical protein